MDMQTSKAVADQDSANWAPPGIKKWSRLPGAAFGSPSETVPAPRRHLRTVLIGVAYLAGATALLLPLRDSFEPATPTAVFLCGVVVVGAVGGLRSALVTAVVAGVVLNVAFLHPYGSVKIRAVEDGIGLLAFGATAAVVGALVSALAEGRRLAEMRADELRARDELVQRQAQEQQRLRAEAEHVAVLRAADEQRQAVLRSVSHDLRTPLSAIRAVVTDLRDGVAYEADTRVALLTTVCDEVDRLDRFVANLLSMSRIEAGVLVPDRQAIDFGELVGVRIDRLAPLLRNHVIESRVPDDLPLLDADYQHVDQIVTNLLANAVRHAPEGSAIWLVAGREGSEVKVEVSDAGPGITAADAERLFEPFARGTGSTSTGVGLAICRSLVEAHGGRIWIERRFGGGTTVAFTLPCHAEALDR